MDRRRTVVEALGRLGFRSTSERVSASFGDFVVEAADARLRVRAVSDRSQESLDVSPLEGSPQWIELREVLAACGIGEHGLASFERQTDVLARRRRDIDEALAPGRLAETLERVEGSRRARVARLFPELRES